MVVSFDPVKIKTAMKKAFSETDIDINDEIYNQMISCIVDKYEKNYIPNVEEIQDSVENILIEFGYIKTAKSYIIYRNNHEKVRNSYTVNIPKLIEDYVAQGDWRVKENSNMAYSLQGLNNYLSGYIESQYWLNTIYDDDIRQAHNEGDFHIHDLSMLSTYCCGWDLMDLLHVGFCGVSGKIESLPPKHFGTALGQIVNFLYTLQGESAGAVAFSNFDTLLAPFIKYDNLTYEQVKQEMQTFVFHMNVPTRSGFQSTFSNITLDLQCPSHIANLPVIIGGEYQSESYSQFQNEMNMINQAFCEIMMDGDAKGRILSFPIPTYNLTKDFDWDNPKLDVLWKMTAKLGIPYFSNFINSDMNPDDAFSMCPLEAKTKIIVKNSLDEITIQNIKSIVDKGIYYQIWSGEKWVEATPIKMLPQNLVKIVFSNGVFVEFGNQHLQPVLNKGTIAASEIKEGDWLPFNSKPIESSKYCASYGLGLAVGAYIGDGSHEDDAVIYSLSETKLDIKDDLIKFWGEFGYSYSYNQEHFSLRIHVNSYQIIKQYVCGNYGYEKKLTQKCFAMNFEFKKGLIDGLLKTDGSRSRRRIYTSSVQMRQDICFLLSSMGEKYLARSEDTRSGRYSDRTIFRIDLPKKGSYLPFFQTIDSKIYYKVEKIEIKKPKAMYCLQVADKDNLFVLANGLITHNCRLRLDTKELRKRGGGLFGANPLTGSINVTTINLPRAAYLVKNMEGDKEQNFLNHIDGLLSLCRRQMKIKRNFLEDLTEKGLYPYSKFYLRNIKQRTGTYWTNHFNTVGVLGAHEAMLNLIGKGIDSDEGQRISINLLNYIRDKIVRFQDEDNQIYNLEATPGESTTYRFAKKDLKDFGDIITSGCKSAPYYTNSTQMPVDFTNDIFTALDIQDQFQTLYTGGCTFHGFLGESIDNPIVCKKLVRKIAENYKLPYFSITPTFSICPTHGYISGEHKTCPHH
jgi:ribonucleoside-triphosphate reductase